MNKFFTFEVTFPLLLLVLIVSITTAVINSTDSEAEISIAQIEYKKWETMQTIQSNDSKCQQDLKFYKNLYEIRNR